MAIYEYTKEYGDASALHSTIAASLSGLLGVTWDTSMRAGHSGNLDIEFETELSAEDEATLDSIVAAFGA